MTTTTNKKKIQNWFNDRAEELGCKARIGGNGKRPKFFEFRGGIDNGFEIWFPIDMTRFSTLIKNFEDLH